MSKFKIAWMLPDTLYLHGERGSVLALERFARIAGFDAEVGKIDLDATDFEPKEYQVIFFGPGEISSLDEVKKWLEPKLSEIEKFINDDRPLIVTGTSVALFCRRILRADDTTVDGLGILDAEYIESKNVYGDDILFNASYAGKSMEIVGNQIQMGDLIPGDEEPFGELTYGYGNSGKDRSEGILRASSIFTSTLGPMLICNPWLTIEIILQAARASGLTADEQALRAFDDSLEQKSLGTKKDFILNKETNLKNCRP